MMMVMTKMVLVMVMMSSTRHQDFGSNGDLGIVSQELGVLHIRISTMIVLIMTIDDNHNDCHDNNDVHLA